MDGHWLVGTTDRHLFEVCKAEGRVFVTLGLDFADIRTYPPGEHPGIIVLRLFRQDELHGVDVFRRMLNAGSATNPSRAVSG